MYKIPPLAGLPRKELVGFGISLKRFSFRIPFQITAQAPGDQTQVHRQGHFPCIGQVRFRLGTALYRINKILLVPRRTGKGLGHIGKVCQGFPAYGKFPRFIVTDKGSLVTFKIRPYISFGGSRHIWRAGGPMKLKVVKFIIHVNDPGVFANPWLHSRSPQCFQGPWGWLPTMRYPQCGTRSRHTPLLSSPGNTCKSGGCVPGM